MSDPLYADYEVYRSPAAASVITERVRQLRQLGKTQAQDDRLGLEHWAWLLLNRIVTLQNPYPNLAPDPARVRELLVEMAAVALAAAEAHDRRHA